MKTKKSFGQILVSFFVAIWHWLKEVWRKFMVMLKRKPSLIPLAVMVVAFLEYSLNMTTISNTTAKLQISGMGLAGLITMLLSMLSLVCFGNAFPHRKPVNRPMWGLMLAMVAAVIASDFYYMNAINYALTRTDGSAVEITQDTLYIVTAYQDLSIHIVILIVGVVLTLLLPIYSKWIKKIKTSIELEYSDNMGEIELDSDE